jgi:hypothetical protein
MLILISVIRNYREKKENKQHALERERIIDLHNLIRIKASYRHPWLKLKNYIEEFYNSKRNSFITSPIEQSKRISEL